MGTKVDSIDALQKVIEVEANAAVEKWLPEKVLKLDELYKSMEKRVAEARQQESKFVPSCEALKEYAEKRAEEEGAAGAAAPGTPASKKRKLNAKASQAKPAQGQQAATPPAVPVQAHAASMLKDLTSEVIDAIELLGKVKTWIQLRIPKIEDGNNFGVAVQEECVGELHRVEDAGFTVLESTTKYHQRRANLSHKMIKHPLIQDYHQAMLECDDVQLELIKITVLDLRNSLFVLHDMLVKNFEKLKKPRNDSHLSTMY